MADSDSPGGVAEPAAPPARSPRARWLVRGAVGLALAWVLGVLVLGSLGALRARQGAERVRDLDLALDVGEVLDSDLDARLAAAEEDFGAADRLLANPLLAPVKVLPVAGRQLRSAAALAGTAEDVLGASTSALGVLRAEVADGAPVGAARVASIDRLRTELRSVRSVLDAVDLGPADALVAPLHDARAEVVGKLTDARTRIRDALTVSDGVRGLLAGPSRYLVLAANNAEMRVGSAMVLSVGTVDVVDGRIRVAEGFEPAGEVVLPEPVPLPADLAQLWGWSTMGADFRSLGLSARFPRNAELAAQMWRSLGREPVDGVLLVDVEGLASVLRITGPVDVEGRRIGAEEAPQYLLREQYAQQSLEDVEENDARRDRLRILATAALERLGDADIDLRTVLDHLRGARDGRHLLAWSARPDVQAAWEAMGVDGELGPRSLLVGLANFDNSKLDPYVTLSADVDVRSDGAEAVVRIDLAVEHGAPEDLPGYVEGEDGGSVYRGLVSAHVPREVSELALTGFDGRAAIGRDGPSVVIAARTDVRRGDARRGQLSFRIPASELERARILPSARVPAVRWDFGPETRPDDSPLKWSRHVG